MVTEPLLPLCRIDRYSYRDSASKMGGSCRPRCGDAGISDEQMAQPPDGDSFQVEYNGGMPVY